MAVIVVAIGFASAPAAHAASRVYVPSAIFGTVAPYSIQTDGSLSPITCSGCSVGGSPDLRGVAIDPSGRFLYASDDNNALVHPFAIQPDGSLSPITCTSGCSTGAAQPYAIAADPTGRFVYTVESGGTHQLNAFRIQSDGSLSAITCAACTTGNLTYSLAIDPTGRYLYAANSGSGTISAFAIQSDGSLAKITCAACTTGSAPGRITVDPNGRFVYVVNQGDGTITAYTINADGSLSKITCGGCSAGASAAPYGIAVDPLGRFVYTADTGTPSGTSAFAVQSDGSLSAISCAGCALTQLPTDLAIEPSGRFMYGVDFGNQMSVLSIAADGTLSSVNCPSCANFEAFALAISPDRGPTAAFTTAAGAAGAPSALDASGSASPDYPIATYQWGFGDGQTATTATPIVHHTYSSPGTYAVTLTVTDQAGCSQTLVYTGQTASCNGSSKAVSSHMLTVPALIPAISALGVSPTRFSLAGRTVKGKCVKPTAKNRHARACRRAIGLTISYALNEPDTVTFTLTFMTSGRSVNGKCVAATKRNRTHKRCRRTVGLQGQIIVSGNRGANAVAFDGKIGRRRLGAGSYLLTGTPAGGSPASTTFTIRR